MWDLGQVGLTGVGPRSGGLTGVGPRSGGPTGVGSGLGPSSGVGSRSGGSVTKQLNNRLASAKQMALVE